MAIEDKLLDTAFTPLRMWEQDQTMQKQLGYQKDAMRYGADLAKELQQNTNEQSPAEIVRGAVKGGFSPLSMLGQSFSPAQGPMASAPSASLDHSSGGNTMSQLLSVISSLKNLDADTAAKTQEAEVKKVEAEGKRIDNQRKESENAGYDLWLRNEFKAALDNKDLPKDVRDVYQSYVDNPQSYDAGSAAAFRAWFDFRGAKSDQYRQIAENNFLAAVAQAKIDNKVPDTLAKMDDAQLKKLFNESVELHMLAMKAASDVELNEAEKAKINAQINEIVQNIKRIYHMDIVQMFKDNDYSGILVKAVEKAYEQALQTGGDIAEHYATGGTSSAAKAAGQAFKETTTKTTYDEYGRSRTEYTHKEHSPFPTNSY